MMLAACGVIALVVVGGVLLRISQCRYAQNKVACYSADKVIYVAP